MNVESVKYKIMQGDADCIILKRLCAETVIKLNGICGIATNGQGAERQYEKRLRRRRSEIIIL